MLTKIFCGATIGLIFGYLSGYSLNYNAALIKIALILILISLCFVKRIKQDIFLKSCLVFSFSFLACFIFASIKSKLLKDSNIEIKKEISIDLKVRDIKIKDSTKIITGIAELESENKSFAVYSHTQEKIYPDDILNVKGVAQNSLIVLPKKEEKITSVKSFDLAKYWNTKGQDFIVMYPKLSKISLTQEEINKEPHSIYYYSYLFREKFYVGLEKVMNNENAGIVMAMLWGDESNISKELNNKYRDAGISHVLVLSGYNLIIVAAFAGFVFKKLTLKKRIIFSVILVSIFLLFANTSSPVWRASVMSLYTFLSIYFLRPANSRMLIWFTGFVFCIYSPAIAIYDVSFHMSFLATLSIIYFYPLLKNIFYIKVNIKDKTSFYKGFLDVVFVTLSANILILPYILYQFGTLKVVGIFISVIISGLIPMIMLFGFLAGILAQISLYAGKIFGLLADIPVNVMSFMVDISHNINPLLNNGLNFTSLLITYIFIYFVFIFLEFYSNVRQNTDYNINTSNNNIEL